MASDVIDLDQLQANYKAAVEDWIAAIEHEEALASVNHSVAEVDKWEAAHFAEDAIRSKVKAAKKQYENALAREILRLQCSSGLISRGHGKPLDGRRKSDHGDRTLIVSTLTDHAETSKFEISRSRPHALAASISERLDAAAARRARDHQLVDFDESPGVADAVGGDRPRNENDETNDIRARSFRDQDRLVRSPDEPIEPRLLPPCADGPAKHRR